MTQRSLYHLKESDPTAFVLPRLDGPAKAALAELLYDEYGGGRPDRLHATLFARALEGCGLDPAYGAYVDLTPGYTLAVNNAMSLFGLHRRLRGAALGHLAAFEATSSLPCRRIASGIRRLGLPDAVWDYFDEHVEADAVHEQVALRNICGTLVAGRARAARRRPDGRGGLHGSRRGRGRADDRRLAARAEHAAPPRRRRWAHEGPRRRRGDALPGRAAAGPRRRRDHRRRGQPPRGDPAGRRGVRLRQVPAPAVVRRHPQGHPGRA